MSENSKVLIIIGSQSDHAVMSETEKLLKELEIPCELHIASAHRTPDKVMKLSGEAAGRGVKVVIAAAGLAAHLAGVVAAHTNLPVIGVPLEASSMGGLDSLLSMVQMPPGVPVATVAVGRAGAKNAAVLAAQMIGLNDDGVAQRLKAYRENMARKVEESDAKLKG
jgi:phosphoribosylaminoimidazole carboxylase PurE protein